MICFFCSLFPYVGDRLFGGQANKEGSMSETKQHRVEATRPTRDFMQNLVNAIGNVGAGVIGSSLVALSQRTCRFSFSHVDSSSGCAGATNFKRFMVLKD